MIYVSMLISTWLIKIKIFGITMNWKRARLLKLIFLITSLAYSQEKPTVVILDFDFHGIKESQVKMLTERMRTEIGNTQAVRLVERNAVDKIMQEQKFQLTGATNDEIVTQLGNLLGVQFMIDGVIGKMGDKYTIDCKMFSVETGETVRTSNVTYEGNISGLILEMQIMAWDIVELEIPERLKFQKYNRGPISTDANPNWLIWSFIFFAVGGGAFLAMGW